MRQAVAPSESVENTSFAVTNLLKICSHCQRLSKKVRRKKRAQMISRSTRQQWQRCRARAGGEAVSPKLMLCRDVLVFYFIYLFFAVPFCFCLESKQAAVLRLLCAERVCASEALEPPRRAVARFREPQARWKTGRFLPQLCDMLPILS